eukprot:3190635-Prorocentrum_lima.AAC.1
MSCNHIQRHENIIWLSGTNEGRMSSTNIMQPRNLHCWRRWNAKRRRLIDSNRLNISSCDATRYSAQGCAGAAKIF